MNMTTWLNEQALLVRSALLAGNPGEARNALRFAFEDDGDRERIRPAMIIRLALSPMSRENLDKARNTFSRQAENTFTAGDDLDVEIRADMYAALFQDRC